MFRELVELGSRLEQERKLPSPVFYDYQEPIRWTIHVWPDRIYLEESAELRYPRPFNGRRSGVEERLLADEASYALGVTKTGDGKGDARAAVKHKRFRELVDAFRLSDTMTSEALGEALGWLNRALDGASIARDPRYGEIESKQWVSFVPGEGPLSGEHLFRLPEAQQFWLEEMQRRSASNSGQRGTPVTGTCSVCGRDDQILVRKVPLGVKLAGNSPLHSLNQDAFTSFVDGAGTAKKALLGLCFECGDTAARVFNYLSDSRQHHREIYRDPKNRDKLVNQTALFWTRTPESTDADTRDGAPAVLDLNALVNCDLAAVIEPVPDTPSPDLAQLRRLVALPWNPHNDAFRINDYAFYLAVLSPNKGRIAVRDWFAVSIGTLKESLLAYLDAVTMVPAWGEEPRPISVGSMVQAIQSGNPNLTRELLRCAYTGAPPPGALASMAGQRLNHLLANETSLRDRQRGRRGDQPRVWKEDWPQVLAAAIKLGLFYGKEEVGKMSEVNPLYESRAYHCGRLLALLEVAQQRHYRSQNNKWMETSTVVRNYSAAASAPRATLGRLLQTATASHLSKAGSVNQKVEAVSERLVELGGMPTTLIPTEQADFGLGFYQERAELRRSSSKDRPEEANAELTDEDSE